MSRDILIRKACDGTDGRYEAVATGYHYDPWNYRRCSQTTFLCSFDLDERLNLSYEDMSVDRHELRAVSNSEYLRTVARVWSAQDCEPFDIIYSLPASLLLSIPSGLFRMEHDNDYDRNVLWHMVLDALLNRPGTNRMCLTTMLDSDVMYSLAHGVWIEPFAGMTTGNQREEVRATMEVLHDFDYKPFFDQFECEDEDAKRFFGLEIEMDDGYRDRFRREIHGKSVMEAAYLKRDGSLSDNGVEFVTMPMSLKYALEVFDWDELRSTALDCEYRSNEASHPCSMHIHVNRQSFGKDDDQRELTLAKLLLIFDKFYDNLRRIARRSDSAARRWADKPNASIQKYDLKCERKEKMKKYKDMQDRYRAVNVNNRYTIEFRLWGGSLNPNSIKSTIDLTNAMIETCLHTNLRKIYDMTWEDFVDTVGKRYVYEGTSEYIAHRMNH